MSDTLSLQVLDRWHGKLVNHVDLISEVVILYFEQHWQVVDSHGTEATRFGCFGHTCESASRNSLRESLKYVTRVCVSTIQLRLGELHRKLISVLDLLPVCLVLLFRQLLGSVEKAVKHARDLIEENVKGGLHRNLHHERVLWRILTIQVSLVNGARHLCIRCLIRTWKGQGVCGTGNVQSESILVETYIEVLNQCLLRHVSNFETKDDLFASIHKEVTTGTQASLALLTSLCGLKSIVHFRLSEIER